MLEVLLHKRPLRINTIGPIVDLTPGSISITVDRLFEKGLVTRVESSEDRRVRIVALTLRGKDLIGSAFRKHAGQMTRVFAELSQEDLRGLALHVEGEGQAELFPEIVCRAERIWDSVDDQFGQRCRLGKRSYELALGLDAG